MPFDKETVRRYGDMGRATQVRRRTQDDLSCYEGDPVAFMRALVDPETGERCVPYPARSSRKRSRSRTAGFPSPNWCSIPTRSQV